MSNLVIASPALSDAATMTDPGGAGSNPTSLQTLQLADQWGLGTTPAVQVDFGSAKNITLVALLCHNGSSTGTWRIRGATSQPNLIGSPGYDSTAVTLWTAAGKPAETWDGLPSIKYLAAGLGSFRWWRIDISDASAPGGQFRAGRLYLCDSTTAWSPTLNASYGLGGGFNDRGTVTRVRGGQAWPGPAQSKSRTRSFDLRYESESDMKSNLFEIQRARGMTKDVLYIEDPAATTHLHRDTIYGLMTVLAPIVRPVFNVFDGRFEIEELVF